MNRGAIACEQAYAQGKMLNNSNWRLPRGITPSDIDLVFDDTQHGRVLFVELSSSNVTWSTVSTGQRILYSNLVARGFYRTFAALAKHEVPMHLQIDTRNDIISFQVMYFAVLGWATSDVYQGELWPRFVDEFYAGKSFRFPVTPK